MQHQKYFLISVLMGCSAGPQLGGDAGDPGDSGNQGDASAADGAQEGGPGGEAGGDSQASDAGPGGDGYDGYTLQPYRRVFITSKSYPSNFGGLSQADKLCGDAASDASLGGTWMAWLSTASTSAASRLEHAVVPYQLLDGTILAADWTELTSGSIRHPIDRDENDNAAAASSTAWTGTLADGSSVGWNGDTCDDWTYWLDGGANAYDGIVGVLYDADGGPTGKLWTDGEGVGCTNLNPASLYCVEQP